MAELLDDGYQILTTDEIIALMNKGHTITLPSVHISAEELSDFYSEEDCSGLNLIGDMNDIISIEYVGEEPVQCIYIDDPDHLYLTDGFIPTHNTSNIVFLKSTDDSMIETLEKMSGKRHQTYIDSKQITRDVEKLWMRNAGAISYTMSTTEEPVISYNDLAFLNERNSIVFRAGDAPIWNRNETILPMSWRLFKTKITQPGQDYTLQTIPTLSSAIDFDVRKNQPNFEKMLEKRIRQATLVPQACEDFKNVFSYDEYQITQLDPDVYAETIMGIVNARKNAKDAVFTLDDYLAGKADRKSSVSKQMVGDEVNTEQLDENKKVDSEYREKEKPRYAGKLLASVNLFDNGQANHGLDKEIIDSFLEIGPAVFFQDTVHFAGSENGSLWSNHGEPFILCMGAAEEHERQYLEEQSKMETSRVFSDDEKLKFPVHNQYQVQDAFLRWLASLPNWDNLVDGKFEKEMARRMKNQ